MGVEETARLAVELTLRDKLSQGITSAERKLKGLDKATSNTQKSLGKAAHNLTRLAEGAAIGVGALVVGAVKAAGDFEAQLNTINTIARETPQNLSKIGDQVRSIARDTGTPLEELTQGYYDLLSAGIKAADAQKVLVAANQLAIGGLATTAETVDLLTTAINTYGGDASKAAEYTDQFAKAVERGKVTADEIAGSFATVGPIAAASGVELRELAAGYARLTAAGVPASEAATQMRAAIVSLTRTTKPLEALQAATGKNYLKIAGKKGLVEALQQLRADAKEAGVPLIDLLGRVEGLNFTLLTTGPNFDKYNADLAAMGDASGTAAEQMAERQKGLNFQLGRLKALARDAGITIGSALLPKIVPLIAKLNEFISKNQDKIGDFGTKLADGFERFAGAVGSIDWAPYIAGIQLTGQVAKDAFAFFNALPAEVKQLAIAALVANKVTGGLGTSIIKDLAGLALRSLTTINAANVTVVGGNVTGGGAGAAGAAGAASLPSVLSLIPLAGIVAAVSGMVTEEANKQGTAAGLKNKIDNPFAGGILGGFTVLPSLVGVLQELLGVAQHPPKTPLANSPGGSPDAREHGNEKPGKGEVGTGSGPAGRREYNRSQAQLSKKVKDTRDAIESAKIAQVSSATKNKAATERVKAASDRVRDKVESSKVAQVSATRTGADRTATAMASAAATITTAIWAARAIISVTTVTNSSNKSNGTAPRGSSRNKGGVIAT